MLLQIWKEFQLKPGNKELLIGEVPLLCQEPLFYFNNFRDKGQTMTYSNVSLKSKALHIKLFGDFFLSA